MPIKYPVCCKCGKVCKNCYHFFVKLCGRCNIIKNREEREAKKSQVK